MVALTGLGSVWRRRFGRNPNDPKRFARAAYYNTTGVPVNGTIRTRTKVAGHARFNSVGGFDPNCPQRMINRVFECDEPCVWQGQNKILFKSLLSAPRQPDYFLVVARQSEIGRVQIGTSGWKSDDGSAHCIQRDAVTSRKACCSCPRAAGYEVTSGHSSCSPWPRGRGLHVCN